MKELFTWDDLAEAISKLSPEQRSKQVFMSIEDEGAFKDVAGMQTVQHDVYAHKDDYEDCGSLEELKELAEAHGACFNPNNYDLVATKGTPFLWDGF